MINLGPSIQLLQIEISNLTFFPSSSVNKTFAGSLFESKL